LRGGENKEKKEDTEAQKTAKKVASAENEDKEKK
jgi:hypothetical protein